MDKLKSYIAFFDLDKTILSRNSGSLLIKEAYRNDLISFTGLLKAIYLGVLYKYNLRDTLLIISDMALWLKGTKSEEIEALSERVVKFHLIDIIRPEILAEIDFHKRKNAEVVLLSSAIEQICRPLANHIGLDKIICTTLEQVNGVLTGLPVNKFCFDKEKRVQIQGYCAERNHNLNEAYYYGDSIADLPALEIIGNPVCITPDKKLRKIAKARNWRISDW